jgi:hypothetical protein
MPCERRVDRDIRGQVVARDRAIATLAGRRHGVVTRDRLRLLGLRSALRVHRRPTVRAEEPTVRDRIPVTTPARTRFDLAPALTSRRLERAIDRIEELRLFDLSSFAALLGDHAGERGTAKAAGRLAYWPRSMISMR